MKIKNVEFAAFYPIQKDIPNELMYIDFEIAGGGWYAYSMGIENTKEEGLQVHSILCYEGELKSDGYNCTDDFTPEQRESILGQITSRKKVRSEFLEYGWRLA